MNRELTKLKAELRLNSDQLKKSEKERLDFKKSLESKEVALEKLRKEKDELWSIVNTDKYKNVRTVELEKDKIEKQKAEQDAIIDSLKAQIEEKAREIEEIEAGIKEAEYSKAKMVEREKSREKLLEVLEEKKRKLERELDLNEQLAAAAKKEADGYKQENAQLKQDVEWLANSAKNNKLQADRAITEMEAYTKILRGMEKKLAETEIDSQSKEAELRELRQKIMFLGL